MPTPESQNEGPEALIYVTVPVSEGLARHMDAIAHRRSHASKEPYDPAGMCRDILETGLAEKISKLPEIALKITVSTPPEISR